MEALATHLAGSGSTGSDLEALLPIRPTGSLRPLFCIHPAVGISWPYARLIRQIPSEHPIYGLQARNLIQRDRLPLTVEEMAADYVSLIREIQPIGPYNLLGWSFGGLVAHAMATELQSDGQEVALLGLLDSYPFANDETLSGRGDAREAEILFAEVADHTLQEMLDTLRREGHALPELGERAYQAITDAYKNNTRIMREFLPKRFRGDVLLFVATEDGAKPPIESWRPHVEGQIKVHEINCTHVAMMDALPAEEIGSLLAKELEKEPVSIRAISA